MTVVLRVVEPGLFTTVQDLDRPNAISAGVPPGGAMDRFAHRAANLLVGNAPGDATLECTLRGPHLAVDSGCLIAITGGDLDPHLNGSPAPMWTSFLAAEGDRITFEGRRPHVPAGGHPGVVVADHRGAGGSGARAGAPRAGARHPVRRPPADGVSFAELPLHHAAGRRPRGLGPDQPLRTWAWLLFVASSLAP